MFGVIIGVDLLDRLLSFDPRLRPTAEEALGRLLQSNLRYIYFCLYNNCNLAHPFFGDLHDPMEEPTTERLVDEHEDANYTIQKWKCK